MRWQSINLSVPVTLRESDMSIHGVVKAISEALKCNVVIDGLVTDAPLGKPGTYQVGELLERAAKLWRCSWGVEGGASQRTLYFLREFSDEEQFPDVSLGELKEFARGFARRLKEKYPYLTTENTRRLTIDYFNPIIEKLSLAERQQVNSSSGIVIGALSIAKQGELVKALYAMELDRCLHFWSELSQLFENLESLECRVVTINNIRMFEINGSRLRTDLFQPAGAAQVEAFYKKLMAGQLTLESQAGSGRVKILPNIAGHFLSAAAVVNEVSLCNALARLHDWRLMRQTDSRFVLEPGRQSIRDDIRRLLPLEYRSYFNSVKGAIGHLTREKKLLVGLLLKLLAGRERLSLKTATELERYVVLRLMLSWTMEQTLREILSLENSPPIYITDYKNASLSIDSSGKRMRIAHPQGAALEVTIRRHSPT